jgi:hypothetical protein
MEKENLMKNVESEEEDDLRPEYDFSTMKGGVRGKYVERYREGTNLVLLDPDVAAASETREAGGSIKPGVERSGTPGTMTDKKPSP